MPYPVLGSLGSTVATNVIVVFEDPASKQSHEGKPYTFASTLDVRCLCGNLMHPIPGAWCTQCGAKVVEVRHGG